MSEVISTTELRQLVDRWIADGKQVAGPRSVSPKSELSPSRLVQYAKLNAADQLLLGGFIRPANSIKEAVFPRHEELYGYQIKGKQIELKPIDLPDTEQIIVGARPCDAASFPILDHVFNWDFRDESYNRRRELTTVITLACQEFDSHCFCTSVGCSPTDTRGSDVMLVPIDGDKFEVRCLTDKGRKLFEGKTASSAEEGKASEGPDEKFDLAKVGEFLAGGYDRPEWQTIPRRCIGCGACAYTCPTCHCFDIVDETNSTGGVRSRNWDACQFSMFTLHASGHNPRNVQGERQRQRIHHKFQIYPEKFGEILCTGCGNCTRNCPVSLGLLTVLKAIATQS